MSIKSARKKKAQELKEKKAAKNADAKSTAAWQEIVDEAHAEALIEDAQRSADNALYDRYVAHDDMFSNMELRLDDSAVKQANYEAELEYRNRQEQMYENMMDVDIDPEAVQKRQAGKAAQDAINQKEVARNSRIDGTVDDLFNVHSNSHEAHAALNSMNRDGFFSSQDDFKTAKARLTAKYDAKPTRASIPRPGRDNLTKESYNRLKSKEIVTVKPGLEFKVNTNAKGELSGIGSMRGGTAGELADATVGNPYFKQVFTGRNLGAVLNLGLAINDFNEARDSGDGVVKAAAKAGTQFVAGEMLGGWMFPVMLAKQAPTMAISAIEGTQKITRQMNSTGRMQTFGEAHFRDTQQLATMRQAGMELAKMSQYNLQQSMMGNEAQYMHRL